MMTPDTIGNEPPHKSARGTKWLRGLLTAAGVLIVFGIGAATGAAGSHPAARPAPAKTVFVTQYPSPEPSPAQPSSSAPGNLTGPLGTAFTDTTTDQSGNDVSYDVTAVRVADPAKGADEFTTPNSGNRFVGVEFKITGDTGYSHDDSNSDAVLIGSDGQTYQADFSSISEGTNFNAGDFGVRAGQTQIGWVAFQVPKGVKVSSVQWAAGSGQPAEWDL